MLLLATCLLLQNFWVGCDMEDKVIDQNVVDVINQLDKRMKIGYKKYGVTTERDDIDFLGWLQHLQEELLDAAIYVERIKKGVKNDSIRGNN